MLEVASVFKSTFLFPIFFFFYCFDNLKVYTVLRQKWVYKYLYNKASVVTQMVKNLPVMQKTWVWKIPWRRHGNSLQYSCLENPHGWRTLVGYSSQGRNEFDMTEWLSTVQQTIKDIYFFQKWESYVLLLFLDLNSNLLMISCETFKSLSRWSKFKLVYLSGFELPMEDKPLCHVQFSSVTQSCPTLCDPMNHSTPGLPVHHQLPEFTQTHVHRIGDAIQPSHPLSSPSPPAPNPSHHQGLFQWVNSSHEVAKVLEFQLQHQSFQWTPRTDLL